LPWENSDGHSNFIYILSPETPKTPKFLTHFRPSRVFHVLQICRILQNTHVNCKRIYPWPIKHIRICRKKCNIVFSICRICRYSPKKHAHDQQKTTWSLKLTEYAEKMQYRHPPIQEHVVYSHLDFIYILKIYIEFRSFGGICSGGILTLQKKQGLVAPANQAFGRYGFLWFLMSFYRFWTVFYGLWRSCFIKNLVLLTKTWFFSQKLAQNQVLIPRPAFFRDLVDVGYMMMISNCGKYLSQPSLRSKISFIYWKSI